MIWLVLKVKEELLESLVCLCFFIVSLFLVWCSELCILLEVLDLEDKVKVLVAGGGRKKGRS